MTTAGFIGHATGTACRKLLDLNALIDWSEVFTIVWRGLITLAIMTYWAGRFARQAWDQLIKFSERMGQAYARFITTTKATMHNPIAVPSIAPIAPIVHPLAVIAHDLEELTVKQLQTMLQTNKRLRKAQLVALAVACA